MSRKTKKKRAVQTVNLEGGEAHVMEPEAPYGAFITSAKNARNFRDLNKMIGFEGLKLRSVRSLVEYLELQKDKFAALMGVSTRTLARWDSDTPIGPMASKKLLEIDKLTKKGVAVFGNTELFKSWLQQPNIALGGSSPIDLLTEPYGLELVEDAIEAMDYGNVM